ncbi:hypothetical protein SAMN05421823_10491 [Catalinimonas alkaloidigena]|uniref:Uncharacterized protein n=1 Tax=Catalinimonas alkaloidigena TaxID=1075417 RepID=A0A1G9GGG7_9BACT|nr:hypothetical protein [Catalinimonas alkaloidigena]SDK99373.1 hypothetical protein SAMN05421823_10491 [Catalinimonas alkaloidigena]
MDTHPPPTNQERRHRLEYKARWMAVLPAAVVAAVAAEVAVWGAYLLFTDASAYSRAFIQSGVGAYAFLLAGMEAAPNHKKFAGLALTLLFTLFGGLMLIVGFVQQTSSAEILGKNLPRIVMIWLAYALLRKQSRY